MEKGKEICKALKEIRRRIASENDIELIVSECRHQGDCAGTCPKCEAEIIYLENQLAARKRLGKTVRVVGLSMGLATIAPALFTSCDPTITKDGEIALQGDVVTQTTNYQNLDGDIIPVEDANETNLE